MPHIAVCYAGNSMIPLDLKDFMIAAVTASASFIGLLFVAISFAIDEKRFSTAELKSRRVLAESSNAALLSVFFISLVALVPGVNIGYVMLIMAWAGFGNVGHFLVVERKLHRYNIAILNFSGLVYVVQGIYAITILLHMHSYTSKYGLMTLFIFLFTIALSRAWELTGVRNNTSDRV